MIEWGLSMNSDELEPKAKHTLQEAYGIEIDELDMLEFEAYMNLTPINDSQIFEDGDYMVELIEDYNFNLA